jgi:iron complex transport system substrate-binding protein
VRPICAAALLQRTVLATAAAFLGNGGLHAQASTSPSAPPAFRTVTDETGRAIRIPQTIHRIVSLAPSATETLYALGLQDLLVGDTDYCDFPPEAQRKPKVGGVINPSIETIASMHPDLVLVTKVNRLETVNALQVLGVPSYGMDPHTVDAVLTSTQRLAQILGAPDAGSALIDDLQKRLSDLQHRLASVLARRVLFVVWPEPLMSIGQDTFIADAIRHGGGVSVVESSQSWPQVNLEEVVKLQPEFLIFTQSHWQGSATTQETLAQLPGWRSLDAVRNHRFITMSDAVNRPSPRIVSAIEELARQLHPEAFTEASSNAQQQSHFEECACAR